MRAPHLALLAIAWLAPLAPVHAGPPAALLHSPHDVIAAWAISPAFPSDHTLFLAMPRFNLLLRSDDAGGSFRTINAGLDTAYVQHVAVSPDFAHDRTLYCVEIGGLFVSHDAGERWEHVSLPPAMRNPMRTAFSPSWSGDRTAVVSTARDGLWVTRDAGRNWERVALPVSAPVTSMHWCPDGNLLALAGRAVLRSADDAGTFEQLAPPPGEPHVVLAADDFGHDGALWIGGKDGVWRTDHHAEGWSRVGAGTDGLDVLDLALASGPQGEPALFASTALDGVLIREGELPWRSSRRGFREPSHQTSLHFLGALPSPAYAGDRTLFAATFEGLYRSFDAGESWEWVNVLHPALMRNVALSPDFAQDGRLALSSYGGGLIGSADRGATFTLMDTGGWMFPDGVALGMGKPGAATVLIGTPNHLLISRDGGVLSTEAMPGAHGFARVLSIAPDWPWGGTAFAHLSTDTGDQTNRFVQTIDGGLTWSDTNLRTVYDVAYSPGWERNGRVYAACNDGVWASVDRGTRFSHVGTLAAAGINSVGVAGGPDDDAPDVIMAASRGTGIHLSEDGGRTWRNLRAGLGATRVAFVAISPAFPTDGTAFAGTLNDGVWVTRDGGANWKRSAGGPSVTLAMEISPTFPEDASLLVGSYDGAWLSADAAGTWRHLDPPLPDQVTPISTRDRVPGADAHAASPAEARDEVPAAPAKSSGTDDAGPGDSGPRDAHPALPPPADAKDDTRNGVSGVVWLVVLTIVVVIAVAKLRPR